MSKYDKFAPEIETIDVGDLPNCPTCGKAAVVEHDEGGGEWGWIEPFLARCETRGADCPSVREATAGCAAEGWRCLVEQSR